VRVYVTTEVMLYEYTQVKEVFVNELDAKKWVADQEAKLPPTDELMSYHYEPRELRTGWRG
jgi:hypothetical protein